MSSSFLFIVLSLATLLCGGGGCILVFLFILGFILLRRRGKKQVTAKEAVKVGAETVSQVFMRTNKGLQAADDDDDDGR